MVSIVICYACVQLFPCPWARDPDAASLRCTVGYEFPIGMALTLILQRLARNRWSRYFRDIRCVILEHLTPHHSLSHVCSDTCSITLHAGPDLQTLIFTYVRAVEGYVKRVIRSHHNLTESTLHRCCTPLQYAAFCVARPRGTCTHPVESTTHTDARHAYACADGVHAGSRRRHWPRGTHCEFPGGMPCHHHHYHHTPKYPRPPYTRSPTDPTRSPRHPPRRAGRTPTAAESVASCRPCSAGQVFDSNRRASYAQVAADPPHVPASPQVPMSE